MVDCCPWLQWFQGPFLAVPGSPNALGKVDNPPRSHQSPRPGRFQRIELRPPKVLHVRRAPSTTALAALASHPRLRLPPAFASRSRHAKLFRVASITTAARLAALPSRNPLAVPTVRGEPILPAFTAGAALSRPVHGGPGAYHSSVSLPVCRNSPCTPGGSSTPRPCARSLRQVSGM